MPDIEYARALVMDCKEQAEAVKETNPKIRRRKQYEAMKPVLYLSMYSKLIYARMHTQLHAFPFMLQKWITYARGTLLPVEAQAMWEAAQEINTVIDERVAGGEEITAGERIEAQGLCLVLDGLLLDKLDKAQKTSGS